MGRGGTIPEMSMRHRGSGVTPGTTPGVVANGAGAFPGAERPRERLLARGAEALADAELLAAILRTGGPKLDAVELAAFLLARFGGVRGLFDAPPESIAECPGMGPAKTASLLATRGLLDRYHAEHIAAGEVLGGSTATRRYLRYRLGRRQREVFGGLFLDARNRLIENEEIFYGSVDRTVVYPREVLKSSMRHNACGVILYHNHPSGIPEPSASDIQLTGRIAHLLEEVDVRLIDHVVVSADRQVSFAERGLL